MRSVVAALLAATPAVAAPECWANQYCVGMEGDCCPGDDGIYSLCCDNMPGYGAATREDVQEIVDPLVPYRTVGCFHRGYRFTPALSNDPITSVGAEDECQLLCQLNDACHKFGFFPHAKECWLGSEEAKFVEDDQAFAGERYCSLEQEECNDPLPPAFPGDTSAETDEMSPGGTAPINLMCWPSYASNQFMPGDPMPCDQEAITTRWDFETDGWPKWAPKLTPIVDLVNETCKEKCEALMGTAFGGSCGMWVTNSIGECYHEYLGGLEAAYVDAPGTVTGGQRIVHGHNRELWDLTGIQLLEMSFVDVRNSHADIQSWVTPLPGSPIRDQPGNTTDEQGIARCKDYCESHLSCQAWQWHEVWGCWVDDEVAHRLPIPTRSNWLHDSDYSKGVLAGKYIQRLCDGLGTPGGTTTTTTPFPGPRECHAHAACLHVTEEYCCPSVTGLLLKCCEDPTTWGPTAHPTPAPTPTPTPPPSMPPTIGGQNVSTDLVGKFVGERVGDVETVYYVDQGFAASSRRLERDGRRLREQEVVKFVVPASECQVCVDCDGTAPSLPQVASWHTDLTDIPMASHSYECGVIPVATTTAEAVGVMEEDSMPFWLLSLLIAAGVVLIMLVVCYGAHMLGKRQKTGRGDFKYKAAHVDGEGLMHDREMAIPAYGGSDSDIE